MPKSSYTYSESHKLALENVHLENAKRGIHDSACIRICKHIVIYGIIEIKQNHVISTLVLIWK